MIPFDENPRKSITRGGHTYSITDLQTTANNSPIAYSGFIIDENGREIPCRWSLNGQCYTNRDYDLIPQK